ncbi:ribosomal-protein-alanine acetyltransferase [Kordiimonas sediminis]|uniref:Ribosomal-protein-alanine acetyltransferase n=1 Tax=Kordiimonas sediminis TaxID=1735581 RepID=A0A919E5J8_9PROT|nr:ribosomal protein S18-alanine N-acetyltransferase [Kordiimonas sediminis]GHF16230.1 ribosomal-protein-alanine acetyltransferase [Kordiimonas sediminis]
MTTSRMAYRLEPLDPANPYLMEIAASLHADAFIHVPDSVWTRDAFTKLMLGGGTIGWLALQDNDPLGILLVRTVLDEAEILTIGVARSAQKKGVASYLMHEGLKVLRSLGIQQVFLEVRRSNLAAQALYRSIHFEEISTRPNYYQNSDGSSEDALIFRLNYC